MHEARERHQTHYNVNYAMTLKTPGRTWDATGFSYAKYAEGFKGVQEGDVIECMKHENVTRRITM